jgi:hypothetical protein
MRCEGRKFSAAIHIPLSFLFWHTKPKKGSSEMRCEGREFSAAIHTSPVFPFVAYSIIETIGSGMRGGRKLSAAIHTRNAIFPFVAYSIRTRRERNARTPQLLRCNLHFPYLFFRGALSENNQSGRDDAAMRGGSLESALPQLSGYSELVNHGTGTGTPIPSRTL